MIEGVVVQMNSEELKTHLLKRLEHHTERAKFYRLESDKFKAEAEDAEIRQGQNTFIQTHEAMEKAAGSHDRLMSWFRFVADHLVPNEVYRLDSKALGEIEAVDVRGYW